MTGVRSPTGAEDFSSSLCVQTGSGAHPASYPMSTGVLSLGVKHGWGMTLTTHPHLVLRSRMSRSYTPPNTSMACSGTACLSQECESVRLVGSVGVTGFCEQLLAWDVARYQQPPSPDNPKFVFPASIVFILTWSGKFDCHNEIYC
jgi:hypothetical protein